MIFVLGIFKTEISFIEFFLAYLILVDKGQSILVSHLYLFVDTFFGILNDDLDSENIKNILLELILKNKRSKEFFIIKDKFADSLLYFSKTNFSKEIFKTFLNEEFSTKLNLFKIIISFLNPKL